MLLDSALCGGTSVPISGALLVIRPIGHRTFLCYEGCLRLLVGLGIVYAVSVFRCVTYMFRQVFHWLFFFLQIVLL